MKAFSDSEPLVLSAPPRGVPEREADDEEKGTTAAVPAWLSLLPSLPVERADSAVEFPPASASSDPPSAPAP